MIAWAHEVPGGRAARADQSLELHRRDDVAKTGVAVLVHFRGVVYVQSDGDYDCANLPNDDIVAIIVINGLLFADFSTLAAGNGVIAQAVVHVQDVRTGYGLWEGDVDGFPRTESHLELIGFVHWTDLDALTAGVAQIRINVASFFADLDREVSDVPGNLFNLAVGEQLNVRMPTGIDGLGAENSYRAVHGGVGLVQLGHDPTDGRLLLNQYHLMPGIGHL